MNCQMGSLVLCLCLIFVILLSHSTSMAPEVDDEREFDYVEGSKKGPKHWGSIKKEWEACNYGRLQSPIDLSISEAGAALGPLKLSYSPTNVILKNRGHDIAIQWEENAGTLDVNGIVYSLKQTHWHSPSEHTIDGKRYDMELHQVYVSQDHNLENKIIVIGVLYELGYHDEFLSKLSNDIESMKDKVEQRNIGQLSPADVKFSGTQYFNYVGSLTVPPCTEGVLWVVFDSIMTVSTQQINLLREAVHDHYAMNARPVQPRHPRHFNGSSPMELIN
ncbi:hypothetical protein FNV43_RR15715 [Rhamnella rubrinervis]|uniref:Alpha-carbonic anhydrase domain-containing protein n=1 Tax=Rhamnella rubrinervis TaxID=2594499 RepID=A0A8K0E299_9ROSA|nr:hypothetical protein FNV43_RR15715 [Rhamnella rubrinervis]